MKLIILILFGLSLPAVGKDLATHQSLTDLLEEVRDPVFNSATRKQILEFSRRMMVKKLSNELNTPEDELSLAFVKNPAKSATLLQDPWIDLQTQFYTTLHQENFYQRWVGLQKLVKFTDYGKSINSTMMAHWGEYSPVDEGRFYARWSNITINTSGKNKQYKIPYFLMSSKTQDLIQMEAHVPYEELFSKTELAAFLKNTPQATRTQRQEIAEKMSLNRQIYIRAVANAAKTVASIHYLSGLMNRETTNSKVGTFMNNFCSECTAGEKRAYQLAAMTYVDNVKETMSTTTLSGVLKNFCSSLKANQYYWNVDRLKPTPVEILADQRKLIDYYIVHKLKKKNAEAIAKTILAQDMGILFLTNSINVLDKMQEPVGTRLGCTTKSEKMDLAHIRASIEEAETNIESYIQQAGRLIQNSRYKLASTNSTLDYFVQTNQSATIEAASNFPQGIGWTLKTIAEMDQNVARRRKTDKMVTWGGTIIGIGLTLTGIGAPEGVAILISTAGVVKGLAAGSYYLVRSQQEKKFAREMRIAKGGSAGLSDANLRAHYKDYKSLKVSYIKEFASSAFNFVQLHRLALKRTNGDIKRAHTVLQRVMETAKETGKEEAIGKLQEMVIEIAVTS